MLGARICNAGSSSKQVIIQCNPSLIGNSQLYAVRLVGLWRIGQGIIILIPCLRHLINNIIHVKRKTGTAHSIPCW